MLLWFICVCSALTVKERDALRLLRVQMPEVRELLEWTGDANCSWRGITCNREQNVVRLQLANLKINKDLPLPVFSLPYLQDLDLHGMSFTGSLGWNVRDLKDLRHLNLASNNLRHVLPTQLGLLTALKRIDVSANALVGVVPASFADLNLTTLNISGNKIRG
jgi:Leucine-rich repeat (LRR) protein